MQSSTGKVARGRELVTVTERKAVTGVYVPMGLQYIDRSLAAFHHRFT